MQKKILIVGQGIAGTVLALSLMQNGHSVYLADADLPGCSSLIAAGIISPVAGKRFAKSWRVDELLPVARQFYRQIEQQWQLPCFFEMPTLWLFNTIKQENEWERRCALPEFEAYISTRKDAGNWAGLIRHGFRFGELRQTARVAFPTLLSFFRKKWQDEGIFFQQKITADNLSHQLDHYDRAVLCTGFRAAYEPFFPAVSWQLAKGEVLIIKIDDERAKNISEILIKNIMLVPLGNGRFWAGTHYEWQFEHPHPTEQGKSLILKELHDILQVNFTVEQHWAGVRPITTERRPVWQWSHKEPRLGIFNGLGSKGALLAPFFAREMAASLA